MPDLARISKINSMCPITSHQHRMANNREINIVKNLNRKHLIGEESYCAICNNQYNSTLKLGWKCPNYRDTEIIQLTCDQKITLTEIFNNHPIFFLPELVHEKIFEYASIYYIDTIDNINTSTLNHLFKCKLCVKKTLEWINFNCCVKHQLPRPISRIHY